VATRVKRGGRANSFGNAACSVRDERPGAGGQRQFASSNGAHANHRPARPDPVGHRPHLSYPDGDARRYQSLGTALSYSRRTIPDLANRKRANVSRAGCGDGRADVAAPDRTGPAANDSTTDAARPCIGSAVAARPVRAGLHATVGSAARPHISRSGGEAAAGCHVASPIDATRAGIVQG
jgi:hypothetical protein